MKRRGGTWCQGDPHLAHPKELYFLREGLELDAARGMGAACGGLLDGVGEGDFEDWEKA